MPRKRIAESQSAKDFRRKIAERLAMVVRKRGLTVASLSQLLRPLGVEANRRSVHGYLEGERDPSGPWLLTVADVLMVRAAWLLTGDGPRDAGNEPSFLQAEKALVDAIAAASVNGSASEAALSAMSDYRDSIAINAEARCTARIQRVAANVAAMFAQEAA